jgi:hypothetical protein
MHSSKVGIFDMAGRTADRAGNALHVDHSTDRFVANMINSLATAYNADIANTADIEGPSTDRSRDMVVRPGRERLSQARRKELGPRKTLSSDCPPAKMMISALRNESAIYMPVTDRRAAST